MTNKTNNKLRNRLARLLATSSLTSGLSNAEEAHLPLDSSISLRPSKIYVQSSAHTKYLGTYGFSITETPVFQNQLGFNIDNLSYNLWSNYDPKEGLSELDHTLSYNINTKNLTIQPSLWYWFMTQSEESEAINASDLKALTFGSIMKLSHPLLNMFT